MKAGLTALPFFYGATIAVNVLSVVHDGPKCKYTRMLIKFKLTEIRFCLLKINYK